MPRPVSLVLVDAESHNSRVGCGECSLASSRVGPNGPSDGFLKSSDPIKTQIDNLNAKLAELNAEQAKEDASKGAAGGTTVTPQPAKPPTPQPAKPPPKK